MRACPLLMFSICCLLGACNQDSAVPKAKLASGSAAHEPGATDLVARGWEVLQLLGHDARCFDSRVVDWRTKRPEPTDTQRPAYQLAVVFTPRQCPLEYCVEFDGMASELLSWCLDRVEPTEFQQRAVNLAYARYRTAYRDLPELQTLIPFAQETASIVAFQFVDRRHWEDLKRGTVESVPEDHTSYVVSKAEVTANH